MTDVAAPETGGQEAENSGGGACASGTRPVVLRIETCARCGEQHDFAVQPAAQGETRQVELICPRLERRWRLTRLMVDFRPNVLDMEQVATGTKESLRRELGEQDFEAKLARWAASHTAGSWLVTEYFGFYQQVRLSYAMGHYYCAMTGAVSLVERVLNEVLLKTVGYYPKSEAFKQVQRTRRDGFQNWDKLIRLLAEIDVVHADVLELAKELKQLRNSAVHYEPGYDFAKGATDALTSAVLLIDSLFNVLDRKDIFSIFDVPGEIWVRNDVESDPFVREFVLPMCAHLAAEYLHVDGVVYEAGSSTGPLTDGQFWARRRSRTQRLGTEVPDAGWVDAQAGEHRFRVRLR